MRPGVARFVLALVVLPTLLGLAILKARADNAAGGPVLAELLPVALAAGRLVTRISERVAQGSEWPLVLLPALPAALGLVALARAESRRKAGSWALVSIAFLVAAEVLVLRDHRAWGAGLVVAAAIVLAAGRLDRSAAPVARPPLPFRYEAAGFVALALLAILSRFLVLDQHPAFWDGETASVMASSTDFASLCRCAFRLDERWVSQGWLWAVAHKAAFHAIGPSFLAIRLVGAVIGTLLVLATYGMMRSLLGPRPALFTGALMAMTPFGIGWGRIEYLFELPLLAGVLVVWATAASAEKAGWRLIPLVLTMGLGSLLYPSGRTLFLVPLVYVPLRLVRDRRGARVAIQVSLALLLGLVLYLSLPTLLVRAALGEWSVMNSLSPSQAGNLWISASERSSELTTRLAYIAPKVLSNMGTLFESTFLSAAQTEYTPLTALRPETYASPFTHVFSLFSLLALLLLPSARRSVEPLLILLCLAALPAGLLAGSEARLFGPFFVGLVALAVAGFVRLLEMLGEVFSLATVAAFCVAISAAVLLGEGVVRYGIVAAGELHESQEAAIGRVLRPLLVPGTLVVADLESQRDSNLGNKVFLELLGDLRRAPRVIFVLATVAPIDVVTSTRPSFESWEFRTTWLKTLVPGYRTVPLTRLVYVTLTRDEKEERRRTVEAIHSGAASRSVRVCSTPSCSLEVVEAPLHDVP